MLHSVRCWTKRQILDGIFYQPIEKWLQLVRPPFILAALLNGILALQAVACGWGARPNYGNPASQSAATGKKKPKWTRLLIIEKASREEHL